jgi:hypothetical protein
MKKTVPENKIFPQLLSGILAVLCVVIAFSSSKASLAASKKIRLHSADSIVVNKISKNKNYDVELSASTSPHKLLISINNQQKKIYHFYLFDVNGNLKVQIEILSTEKVAFVNIEKGSYYYEILNGDEKIENGQLSVK